MTPAIAFRDIPAMRPYAQTAAETMLLDAYERHGSMSAVARALGRNRNQLNTEAGRIIGRAIAAGWAPAPAPAQEEWPANSSTLTRGLSADGDVILQWDIRRQDKYQREEAVRQAIAGLIETIEPEPNTPAPARMPSEDKSARANVFTITDAHIGCLAWAKETGAAWDTNIGERVVTRTMVHAVTNAVEADTAYVVFLGDIMHYDSLKALTPAHGHILDGDTRYPRLAKAACRMAAAVVRAALATHTNVKVVVVEGNHDEVGSGFWLGEVLEARFWENDRVQFLTGPRVIRADMFGSNMLAWHHGHTIKPDQLQGAVSSEYRALWGRAARTYVHVGHRHSKWVPPARNGLQIVQHATLAGRDAYAARLAVDAERLATVYTDHADVGEIASRTWTPGMVGAGEL